MPEQVLHGADVGTALQQVGGAGMTKGVCSDVLRQTGTANCYLDGFVDDAGGNMMATGVPERGSTERFRAEKTYGQPHSVAALGCFRA